MDDFWKKCSFCKKEIALGAKYYVCSVSSCNLKRTGLTFCTLQCWDAHLPIARHKNAWAEERKAPATTSDVNNARQPLAAKAVNKNLPTVNQGGSMVEVNGMEIDVLVVASKVKKYIKDKADMNTSGGMLDELTKCITVLCDKSIENARKAGRRTVMDRDVPSLQIHQDESLPINCR